MKKYKLKKDLPTWKAGEEFFIGEDECLYGMSEEGKPIMVYHAITLVNFDLLKNSEWFEEVKEKKSIWDLKEGDTYYYLDLDCSYSKVSPFIIFTEDDFLSYKSDLENGNVFLTEEEAEEENRKREAIQRIKKYCWENGIEFADKKYLLDANEPKYYFYFDNDEKKFEIDHFYTCIVEGALIFKDRKGALQVVENCEDNFKILFNV